MQARASEGRPPATPGRSLENDGDVMADATNGVEPRWYTRRDHGSVEKGPYANIAASQPIDHDEVDPFLSARLHFLISGEFLNLAEILAIQVPAEISSVVTDCPAAFSPLPSGFAPSTIAEETSPTGSVLGTSHCAV